MRFLSTVLTLGLVVPVLSCVTAPEPKVEAGPEWINNMHRLSVNSLRVAPTLSDPKMFADPKQARLIEGSLRELVQGAHATVYDPRAPAADPVIAYTAAHFADNLQEAYKAWRAGDQQWARYNLSHMVSYCISCHTRGDHGAKNFALPWAADFSHLNAFTRAEFLLANRQYESAQQETLKIAADPQLASLDPREWQLALERILAVDVRVLKNPRLVIELSELAAENRGAPLYMRRQARAWKASAKSWAAASDLPQRPLQRFKEAERLLQEPNPEFDRGPSVHLIEYLRASALLHELVEEPQQSFHADALDKAGIAEELLQPVSLAGVGQSYFETCIRSRPHSERAETCFSHLERSVREDTPFLQFDPGKEEALQVYLGDLRRLSLKSSEPAPDRNSVHDLHQVLPRGN